MVIAFLLAASALPKATAIDVGSWFSADDYPAEAQRNGIEGKSSFEVDVDPERKPTACRITHSSGSAILDKTTCDIVLKKAQFKPAMSHGHPVVGRYSQSATWKLEGTAMANGYAAVIIDFSKDQDHPTCSIVNKGFDPGSMCAQALSEMKSAGAHHAYAKVVALASMTTGAQQPYRGEPGWGRRLSFVAIDLYASKSGSKPSCTVVAQEGTATRENPCASYSDAATLSDEDKNSATKMHIERSIFAIPSGSPAAGKCKDGESAAEVQACV